MKETEERLGDWGREGEAENHLDVIQRWPEKDKGLLWAPSGKIGMNRKDMKEW